jgi:Na+/H+ antiporter
VDETLIWFTAAAALAIGVAAITRQRGWGMAIPVLIFGAIIELLPIGIGAPTQPEIVLVAVLAPLVFGEALGSSYLDLRKFSRPILLLAVGLVIATTFAVGGVVLLVVAMPVAMALALGAILAPTDAVAVSAVARRASLPRRLVSILEGESLVNDGTGLTALRVAVIAAVVGSITFAEVSWVFAASVIGGVAVGALGGWSLSWVVARSADVTAANALVIIAPFALYLGAEAIEGSGILAVVVAALWIAHAQTSDPSQRGRMQSAVVWRHITFMLQAVAFFLIGMEFAATMRSLVTADLMLVLVLIPLAVITLIATRALFIALMVSLPKVRGPKHHGQWREAAIVAWAGTRGPVSGMAAFSLPLVMRDGEALPYRDVVVATTMGVIVVTLLISLTIAPVARWLRIPPDDDAETLRRVHSALATAAFQQLTDAQEQADLAGHPLPSELVAHLRRDLEGRLDRFTPDTDPGDTAEISLAASIHTQLLIVQAEKAELLRIRDEEGLPDAIVRPLLAELDARERALN